MNIAKLIFIIFTVSIARGLGAQTSELDKAPIEELIVTLNRTIFIPGEELKVGIRSVNDLGSFQISKVAYIELLSPTNEPVFQKKVSLENHLGNCAIYLPSYLNTGNYTLVVYTQWMRNFGVGSIVQRQISLMNPFKKLPSSLLQKKISTDSLYLDLFPEGGVFVDSKNQNVGFKILNELGQIVPSSIQITDDESNLILDIDSKKGYGHFTMAPAKDKEYVVTIIDSNENIHLSRFNIVKVVDHYTDLIINDNYFEIEVVAPITNYKLLIKNKNQVINEVSLETSSYKFLKRDLPKGLLTFIIQDDKGGVVYKRTAFNEPLKKIIELSLNKKVFIQREKITLSLNSDLPFNGSLVIKKIQPVTNSENSISSYYLGSANSTIPLNWPENKVETDLFFFLDNQKVWSAEPDKFHLPDFRGELIEGSIKDLKGSPVANHKFYVSTGSETFNLYSNHTDDHGIFRFSIPYSTGANKLVFSDIKNYIIELQQSFLNEYDFIKQEQLFADSENLKDWLIKKSQQVQVKNLYLKQDKIENEEFEGLFKDQYKETYLLDNFTRFSTMEDHIIEYVSLVELRRENNKTEFFIRNLRNRNGIVNNVLITLNGVVCTIDQIFSFDPLKIEKIEVYTSQIQLGGEEFTGAINFLTYKDADTNNDLFNNAAVINHIGVEVIETHSNSLEQKPKIPDMRVQLGWEPHLSISSGKTILNYICSDIPGLYEIILSATNEDSYIYERIEFEILANK